jgi:hypothetical protein
LDVVKYGAVVADRIENGFTRPPGKEQRFRIGGIRIGKEGTISAIYRQLGIEKKSL